MNYKIKWIHVSSASNMADISTRQYSLTPDSLPWSQEEMIVTEESRVITTVPGGSLPDADKKQLLNCSSMLQEQPDLAHLLFYSEIKQANIQKQKQEKICLGTPGSNKPPQCGTQQVVLNYQSQAKWLHEIDSILQRNSSWWRIKNMVARILG